MRGPRVVRVDGHEYRWQMVYPGPDGVADTPDDRLGERDLLLLEDCDTTLVLTSQDFVYTVDLPAFDARQIAVPELEFRIELDGPSVGESLWRSDPMCGLAHPDGPGRVFVLSPKEYAARIRALARRTSSSS